MRGSDGMWTPRNTLAGVAARLHTSQLAFRDARKGSTESFCVLSLPSQLSVRVLLGLGAVLVWRILLRAERGNESAEKLSKRHIICRRWRQETTIYIYRTRDC